ncbi:MAG: cell division protein CrgA [Acidimicrobiales bacterium]
MADDIDEPTDDQAIAGSEGELADDPGATVSVAPFIDDEADQGDPVRPADAADREGGGGTASGGVKEIDDAADAPVERTVTRRTVTSKRVTPKGGGSPAPSARRTKAGAREGDVETSSRYTRPGTGAYAPGPSPWWVPTLMFALLIIGALIIMTNYMGVFGEAANIRLVIGLVCILGGIVTATQYR